MSNLTYITTVRSICSAHRLHNPELSDEENKSVFGKCNHISSHGHNYKIELSAVGETDPKYGFCMNLRDLKKILVDIVDPMDHKRLDTDIEFFKKGNIATAENMAIYIWQEAEKMLPRTVKLYNVRVHETDNNYIDYKGE